MPDRKTKSSYTLDFKKSVIKKMHGDFSTANFKQVSEEEGVTVITLRAWAEKFGGFEPKKRGDKVKLVAAPVAESIRSYLINLSKEDFEKLVELRSSVSELKEREVLLAAQLEETKAKMAAASK